jgi:glycosyltransferase involved in cell wall biosynthesis
MKICIVGPGIMPIPPTGWGAVEIIIWDYKQILEKLGHEVIIVNTKDPREIINICNSHKPDVVHVQYDEHYMVGDSFDCDNVIMTTYFAYADQVDKHDGYYRSIFDGMLSLKRARMFVISPSIRDRYLERGFDPNRIEVVSSGVRDDLFSFKGECEYPDKSIYLAKIDYRKRQHLFHNIPDLYFAGNIADDRYNKNNYLGEWNKDYLYENLTNYANLVLLSDGEAHPLVCMEAMSAGLGLVISEFSTANLDLSLPFIDVIPESRMHDIEYISEVIKKNREKSISMRKEIRDYVISNFSWESVIKNQYLPKLIK